MEYGKYVAEVFNAWFIPYTMETIKCNRGNKKGNVDYLTTFNVFDREIKILERTHLDGFRIICFRATKKEKLVTWFHDEEPLKLMEFFLETAKYVVERGE